MPSPHLRSQLGGRNRVVLTRTPRIRLVHCRLAASGLLLAGAELTSRFTAIFDAVAFARTVGLHCPQSTRSRT